MRRRVLINLVALGLVATALFVYLITDLLADVLFEDTYPLLVELPDSGGLIANQEVTLAGRVVGLVADVDLVAEGVVAQLDIFADERIPTNTRVVVQRRSAVGEQAIDFVPIDEPEDFYAEGALVDGSDARLPVRINELFESAEQALGGVDPETAGELVAEVADGVRGRRESIRALIADSGEFSATMADGDEHWDRLFREGRTVTAALRDVRAELGESIGLMADSAAILADARTDFEALLIEAPPALAQLGGVVERAQPNISCLLGHVAELNAFLGQPHQMDNAERAFRANQYFFVGYPKVLKAKDEDGRNWNRVHVFTPEDDLPPERYAEKRPIPATLPGGSCESAAFGPGAPSATQADHEIFVPEGRVIRPEADRTTPVRAGGPPLSQAGAPRAAVGGRVAGDGELPATGGPAVLLLGALLLGAGVALGRRAGTLRADEAQRDTSQSEGQQ